MKQTLPPLTGLRAFEATARHLSMTTAAKELNVTPGAVSLQVKELEMTLGVTLFVRQTRSLSLTQDGQAYFAAARAAFRLIREATADLTSRRRPSVLTISCTPTFAMQWLVPRLSRFEETEPRVDVRLNASNRLVDFARDAVHLAIRHGRGRYDGLRSERLIDDDLLPVCSPEHLKSAGPITSAADLRRHTLLHDEHRGDWRLWFHAAGFDDVDAVHGPLFTESNGAVEAAKAGLGIALLRESLVVQEIAAGRLVAPLGLRVSSDLAYHLVYPAETLELSGAAAFRAWIFNEASADATRVAPTLAAPPLGAGGR